ncbi:MAG: rhomboid family intramembrane serine protease [Saprospiraceae bacterium]|nr:rhomboid family intramembrane serine protease [Saprospiraceae bacterium]
MFQSILADIRKEFSTGNMISRLIIINVGVFILINMVRLILHFSNGGVTPGVYYDIVHFFSISSSIFHNLTHPWVFITSIFLHEGFWHILWNMLFLYWFGRIVADLIGESKIFPIYLLGGVIGCLVFWMSAQLLPYGGTRPIYALGASAGVMAIVMTSGMIAPDYVLRLFLLGDVKLKYVVAVLILLDLFGLAGNYNTGGHFAHLGGVFMGWFYVQQLRTGNDWGEGVNGILRKVEQFFTQDPPRKSKAKQTKLVVKHRYRKSKREEDLPDTQERIDFILDKIKAQGYNSLTQEEKDFLREASEDS